MSELKSIASLVLDLPPSCIQFCPTQPELFVIGTYFLHQERKQTDEEGPEDIKKPQKRTGSLVLFRLDSDKITHLSTLPTDFAILDLQWSPHSPGVLAVATSTGSLAFYHLSPSHQLLPSRQECQITDPATLVLSLTWHPTRANIIGVTLSNGAVNLIDNRIPWHESSAAGGEEDNGEAPIITTLHSHSLEAWTLAISPSPPAGTVLSGGDDAALRCTRVDTTARKAAVLWEDRKLHSAGVTAVLPLSRDLVLTGCYDDRIRLISLPTGPGPGRRQVLAERDLGGGVWRLKVLAGEGGDDGEDDDSVLKRDGFTILASCMHAGTRIIKVTRGESWNLEVQARFEEHQSMNYGSDVQPGTGATKTIVSTSFYDKLVCLWEVLI